MKKLLVLMGPTASGKTGIAIRWARQFGGEIVGADSRQVYRYMQIGTAAPTPDELAAAPHHLVYVVDPDAAFTLAHYQTLAFQAIDDILSRERLPVLVGGTGLYITAVVEGWRIPRVPPDPARRADLETRSVDELVTMLSALDPAALSLIDMKNPRRLVRAIEICLGGEMLYSQSRQKHPPDYDILPFVVSLDRSELHRRADARIGQMIAAGWVDEVTMLLQRGYTWDLPSMSAIGYPEIGAYVRGETTLEQAQAAIETATHQYIRRQHTWLRGHATDSTWFAPNQDMTPLIARWLAR